MTPTGDHRPNLLVILTDEERERAWWPDSFRLPHRDRLAARGVRFTAHHVHSMPCSPSRSNLMTGLHTHATGVLDNVDFAWQGSMPTSVPTLGHRLRAAGYRTSYVGKWHLSRHDDLADGLEPYGFGDWVPPDRHGAPYLGHRHDGGTAAEAARLLARRRPDDRPWAMVVSFVNPHDIMLYPRFRTPRVRDHGIEPPVTLHEDLATKPAIQRRWRAVCDLTAGRVRSERTWRMIANAYADLCLEVDGHIGTVLDALAASGEQDRTVVVCTSDHGDLAGAHGQRQKGAFIYREITRVPLTVAGPGVTPAGAECPGLTAAIDLVPTLLAIAGVPAAARADLPGVDLGPLLTDPAAASPRSRVLYLHDAHTSIGPQGPAKGFLRGSTDGRWSFGRYFLPGHQHAPLADCDLELYDDVEDPWQVRNLAGDPRYAEVVAEQAAATDALVAAEVGDDVVVPPPPRSKLSALALVAPKERA